MTKGRAVLTLTAGTEGWTEPLQQSRGFVSLDACGWTEVSLRVFYEDATPSVVSAAVALPVGTGPNDRASHTSIRQ